ncbi:hypothetical protein B9Z55_006182 [Caenorhabditis nigoni]|uniref:Guanine nucleotide-binding protein-like 3 N-terminal domain-containing protein n=1 Tax=Caenorhabditis nigoni TaxID=1611254 RepID=A0A2G5V415_9PELO|nr:hypothetical protein B9Z55_006182 [Caenorhabditis nigoni]
MRQKKKLLEDQNRIPRVKKEDFLKKQKKRPAIPLEDAKDSKVLKERRQRKRIEKREKQRRKDISHAYDAALDKNAESLGKIDIGKEED